VTPAELVTRLQETYDRTGDLDWGLVREDFEVHDHELPDSSVHRGRAGWRRYVTDWRQAFEDYDLERLRQVEVDETKVLTVHRLRARGRASGVELQRVDAQLWTCSGDRIVRLDYYPDFRDGEEPWAT
jgi:ketosteroid isomerase-like protein